MDEEKYRLFLAIAAVATTLTFVLNYAPRLAEGWSAVTGHPWVWGPLLLVLVVGGGGWGLWRWLDER